MAVLTKISRALPVTTKISFEVVWRRTVTVDPARSLSELLDGSSFRVSSLNYWPEDLGKWQDLADDLPDPFEQIQELELVAIKARRGRYVDTDTEAVLQALDNLGLRPVTLKELLSCGFTEAPTVALGSIWELDFDDPMVAILDGYDLTTSWRHDLEWGSDYDFVGVSK